MRRLLEKLETTDLAVWEELGRSLKRRNFTQRAQRTQCQRGKDPLASVLRMGLTIRQRAGELDLGHAAVYEEFDAGDEAGVVGG